MRLAILGLPQAGKTTIFNALTGSNLPVGDMAGGARPETHTAVVDVPDPRLDALTDLFQPRKSTHARVTYAEFGGWKPDSGGGLPGPLVNQLEQMDGILHVVRAFDDPAVPHPSGSIDPQRDFEQLQAELLLNDMLIVERRQRKLDEERQRGGRARPIVEREQALFGRLAAALDQGQRLESLAVAREDTLTLAGIGLLTRKPMLVLLNLAEDGAPPQLQVGDQGLTILPLLGKLEMEIAELAEDEVQVFLEEYGLESPGRQSVLLASYSMLGMQTFFTASEPEVRAWILPQGGTALQAADVVHSDMARGFIRAEVIAWDELVQFGGLAQARAQGRLRVEGKEYPVKDGDVIHIRFNL
jgi:ribosome-binding ATPase